MRKSLHIKIDDYGNQSMVDDPVGETVRILRGLAQRYEDRGRLEDVVKLRDINGNAVGEVNYYEGYDDDEEPN